MDRIGLTGSTGSLGKEIKKQMKKRYIFFCFKGDIRNKKKVYQWIEKKNINIIIHLAAIVPIKNVNKNKKLAKQGNKEAIDWFRKAINVNAKDPEIYKEIGDMKRYLKEYQEAIDYYEKVLSKSNSEIKEILGNDAMIRIYNRILEYRKIHKF